MSKIHQAVRKAEREGLANADNLSPVRRDILEDMRRITQPLKHEETSFQRVQPSQKARDMFNLEVTDYPAVKLSADPKLVAISAPQSIPTEQYRALKASIFQVREEKSLKTILITSAGVSDGKTITAINLAVTIAHEIDLKVLIVDGDLRRPSVHRYLGVANHLGLSNYLSGNCSLGEVVYKTDVKALHLVVAGTRPDNPAELLNSPRMQEFLDHVSNQYDWVILDSPPASALADADVLASKVDGVLLVVRASHTPSRLLTKSMEALEGRNLLGVVLNDYESEKASKYDSYYYGRGSEGA